MAAVLTPTPWLEHETGLRSFGVLGESREAEASYV